MDQNKMPVLLKLTEERAWRTYLGGSFLGKLHGRVEADNHFPEEWIMSVVAARNTGREDIIEGLSCLCSLPELTFRDYIATDPENLLGKDHVDLYGSHPGLLVKLIDSAERLAIQVHPDRVQAKRLFDSAYGKTEAWYILGGRMVNGEEPCIYLGFKEEITEKLWRELFVKQDIPGMLNCLHRFSVQVGDMILIEGGVPHAIGAGCFLAEVQEPTDYTLRVEKTTQSGLTIPDTMCHQGLGFEQMFECFTFEGLSEAEVRKRWFIRPQIMDAQLGGKLTALLQYHDTPYFALNEITVTECYKVAPSPIFFGLYVLAGCGIIICGKEEVEINKGEQLFVPAQSGGLQISCEDGCELKLLQMFGPRI